MKILVPIMEASDIDVLNPHTYGTEFFCGYLPQWWIDKYNSQEKGTEILSTPINNRNNKAANVTSFDELTLIVEKAMNYKTDVFLALNAKYYPDYIYNSIETYIEEIVSAGIKRVIVCDLGMINYLSCYHPEIKVTVSCLNQVTNKEAVEFYRQFDNIDRVVFPRHMSSEEIKNIADTMKDMEFEYFIFSNKCLYDDGYCRGIHEFTPICKDLFYNDFYSKNGDEIGYIEKEKLKLAESNYTDWTRNELLWEEKHFCTANFACNACSLLKLYKSSNVASVKISIRGHHIEERLQQVKMAREAMVKVEEGFGLEGVKGTIERIYGKENLCKDGTSCMMV